MSRTLKFATPLLLVLCVGCQSMRQSAHNFGNVAQRFTDYISGNTPRKAAVQMEDPYFPDERREGINALVERDFGKRDPYLKRYEQIAQFDEDWLVRATAIRALNRARDRSATPIFIKALDDKNDRVRTEAAKALANVPDENAIPALVQIVNDTAQDKDLRIAAADALKHYHSLEVARALVNNLGARDFGVAWQSRQTLRSLTGKDLRYDEAAWLAYLTGPEKPFG
jgi:thioredoxin-like negative regulator of GroEL